jgi:transposase
LIRFSEGSRSKSSNLFWLSDEQWERISGIVHLLKMGAAGAIVPEAYGLSTTTYSRFVRWARRGV